MVKMQVGINIVHNVMNAMQPTKSHIKLNSETGCDPA